MLTCPVWWMVITIFVFKGKHHKILCFYGHGIMYPFSSRNPFFLKVVVMVEGLPIFLASCWYWSMILACSHLTDSLTKCCPQTPQVHGRVEGLGMPQSGSRPMNAWRPSAVLALVLMLPLPLLLPQLLPLLLRLLLMRSGGHGCVPAGVWGGQKFTSGSRLVSSSLLFVLVICKKFYLQIIPSLRLNTGIISMEKENGSHYYQNKYSS